MNWFVRHYDLIMFVALVIWSTYFVVLVIDDLKGEKNNAL